MLARARTGYDALGYVGHGDRVEGEDFWRVLSGIYMARPGQGIRDADQSASVVGRLPKGVHHALHNKASTPRLICFAVLVAAAPSYAIAQTTHTPGVRPRCAAVRRAFPRDSMNNNRAHASPLRALSCHSASFGLCTPEYFNHCP
jgi:hypothetical protein